MNWKFLTFAIFSLLLLSSVPETFPENSHNNGDKIYAEHPKGCAYLKCESGDQCVNRKFWCKNLPCPSMLYCSKNRKESLRGPSTCDSVRCSKGYICLVKVRRCRWDRQCKQQMARCVSMQEYYEGPASCAGFLCGAGHRCILRESLCALPPCKLLTSCAKQEDVQTWFDRCRSLGCPSEHECFLRKPIEYCPNPPCKHTPDCTTTNENEAPPNEHCRGWICPRIQECSVYIQEPCGSDGCKINRSCHGPQIVPTNLPEPQGHYRTSTLRPNFQKAPNRKPLKTLTQMEKELVRQVQKMTTTMTRTRTKSAFPTTTEMAAVAIPKVNRQKIHNVTLNQSSLVPTGVAHEIPNIKSYVAYTAKPTLTGVTLPSKILSKVTSTTSASSSWLNHLRLRTGVDAIDTWVKNAREGKNYSKFEEWLESVEETLGPETFELWLEEVRKMTRDSPEFQEWLPPPSRPRLLDSHHFFDPDTRLADMEDEPFAGFPKVYDWTNRSFDHLREWNIPEEVTHSDYDSALPDRNVVTTMKPTESPRSVSRNFPKQQLSQKSYFEKTHVPGRAHDVENSETTTVSSLWYDQDPVITRTTYPYVRRQNSWIPRPHYVNKDVYSKRTSSTPVVPPQQPYRGIVRHWSDQDFEPEVNNFPRFGSELVNVDDDGNLSSLIPENDYPAFVPSSKRARPLPRYPRVKLINQNERSHWVGKAEKSDTDDSTLINKGSHDVDKDSVRYSDYLDPSWDTDGTSGQRDDTMGNNYGSGLSKTNDRLLDFIQAHQFPLEREYVKSKMIEESGPGSSGQRQDHVDEILDCEQLEQDDPFSKNSQLYEDNEQTTLNMFMPNRLQVSIPIAPWTVNANNYATREYFSFGHSPRRDIVDETEGTLPRQFSVSKSPKKTVLYNEFQENTDSTPTPEPIWTGSQRVRVYPGQLQFYPQVISNQRVQNRPLEIFDEQQGQRRYNHDLLYQYEQPDVPDVNQKKKVLTNVQMEQEFMLPTQRPFSELLFQRRRENALQDHNEREQVEVNYDYLQDPQIFSVDSTTEDKPEDIVVPEYEDTSDDNDCSSQKCVNEIDPKKIELRKEQRDLRNRIVKTDGKSTMKNFFDVNEQFYKDDLTALRSFDITKNKNIFENINYEERPELPANLKFVYQLKDNADLWKLTSTEACKLEDLSYNDEEHVESFSKLLHEKSTSAPKQIDQRNDEIFHDNSDFDLRQKERQEIDE